MQPKWVTRVSPLPWGTSSLETQTRSISSDSRRASSLCSATTMFCRPQVVSPGDQKHVPACQKRWRRGLSLVRGKMLSFGWPCGQSRLLDVLLWATEQCFLLWESILKIPIEGRRQGRTEETWPSWSLPGIELQVASSSLYPSLARGRCRLTSRV